MPLSGEPVPTPTDPEVEYFGLRVEALRSADPAARAAWWRAAWDECFAAIANRCTRPIVIMSDDWLRSLIARMGDAETLGWTRGFKPVPGQDAWIENEVKRIREDFELLALGRRHPVYTDSTPTKDEKSPRLSYNETSSDAWVKNGLLGCGCGNPFPGGKP